MTTYYVSPNGNDNVDGQSPGSAWRTLARADQAVLQPGDQLLLEGGGRFPGTLSFGSTDAGSAANPVVIGSYGTGRATILASGTAGITIYNTAGMEIRDLVLVGSFASYSSQGGLNIYSDLPGNQKLDHLVITNVDASGFKNGIQIGGGNGSTGFRNVTVDACELHANREAGLITYGPAFNAAAPAYPHESVTVTNTEAHHNAGDPKNNTRNTGSGIILGAVDGGAVRYSSAHDNGYASGPTATEGPEGIWAYDSTGLVIEHNVSYFNRTGGKADGGGFGLDINVSESVLQYNLSFGNDGPGYLIYTSQTNNAHTGNTVRFNVSSNDARKPQVSWYAGISLGGRLSNLQVYQNTVVLTANGTAGAPALGLGTGLLSASVRNTILVTDGARLVRSSTAYPASTVQLQGNDYFTTAGTWAVTWGTTAYGSLNSWRTATGQERVGTTATGLNVAPDLLGGDAPFITDPDVVWEIIPESSSPLVGQALDLQSLFGIDPGPHDYFGTALGSSVAVGAAQPQP
ncbi:right-handed parallel beta-helix repeat-containing protein [Streptomyces phyllanthi]|uniref:Right-handed parallel beta-helix repeat-containing protein n=1 Tax=Streptomyces phyllanthi TaxID=1803180 RepID=A0A5N8W1P1_9ACTN|nr:right-handed parallel beta-helix repeat-containing protein [Streptomyces phyllanthi]MPY41431.1 right-handed parallel beta-helix repeat-containing protein [Streptomyces phyllanthi]